jgi:hypothetical protein
MQVEELELQIADLTANFRMRDQFSGESNAQIYGTTGNEAKPNKKGGKKSRRFFRKCGFIGVGTGVRHSSDDEDLGKMVLPDARQIGPVPSALHPPGGVHGRLV